jgi:hypothetical protein
MRTLTVGIVVLALSAFALGQAGARGVPGFCTNCGPYIPLISTPNVGFETVSPSPVGATNATGGLHAGARNSTLSMVDGNPDAVHTQVVWYSGGGSPLVSPAVRLPRPEPMGMGMHAGPEHMEHGHGAEERQNWTYYASSAQGGNAAQMALSARASSKKAVRTYTNDDVNRVAQKNEEFRKK